MADNVKRALITGLTGQDGSYLAELLLGKGYEVHGLIRRSSSFNTQRIDHLYRDPHEPDTKLFLHHGDMTDANSLVRVLRAVKPHEVYNLAAQSHVRVSFDQPIYTADVDALGALRLLEAVRDCQDATGETIRYYQASSSEMFGDAPGPLNEDSPFRPRSPYGCAKVFAHHATVNYREAYGLHASCGIMFNHESPRRGETFVTRKITRAATRIKLGLQDKLYIGSLLPGRDWGFAGDYVKAMWLMLQQDNPDDYVIATGKMVEVAEFCRLAFAQIGLDYKVSIKVDSRYFRAIEIWDLCGDAAKAKRVLGWEPTTTLHELVTMMVEADMKIARLEKMILDAGHSVSVVDAARVSA